MRSPLVPCPGCRRHVFAKQESVCPFCAAALPDDLASRAIPAATSRLTRAAAFAFTASLSVVACSSGGGGDPTSDGGGVTDTGGPAPAYGAPAYGQPADDGGNQVLYGASPPDASADAATDAMPDGGSDGAGGVLYGLPPPDGGGD